MSNIIGRFIIQIAGKPALNVEKATKVIIEKIDSQKDDFKLIEKFSQKPTLDSQANLFMSFIEVCISFKSIDKVLGFITDYTPNSIEIEDPENLKISNNDISEFLNNLSNSILKLNAENRALKAHIHNLQNKK